MEKNTEEKDLGKLFEKAKQAVENSDDSLVEKDENKNNIYKVKQTLAKYKNKNGEILEKVATTSNQRKTVDYGATTSYTIYPDSSWTPVPATFGSSGSIVGNTMEVKLGRSSTSTWMDTFQNNLK